MAKPVKRGEQSPDDEIDEVAFRRIYDQIGKERGIRAPLHTWNLEDLRAEWGVLVERAAKGKRVALEADGVRIAWAKAACSWLKDEAETEQERALLDNQLTDIERFLGFPS